MYTVTGGAQTPLQLFALQPVGTGQYASSSNTPAHNRSNDENEPPKQLPKAPAPKIKIPPISPDQEQRRCNAYTEVRTTNSPNVSTPNAEITSKLRFYIEDLDPSAELKFRDVLSVVLAPSFITPITVSADKQPSSDFVFTVDRQRDAVMMSAYGVIHP